MRNCLVKDISDQILLPKTIITTLDSHLIPAAIHYADGSWGSGLSGSIMNSIGSWHPTRRTYLKIPEIQVPANLLDGDHSL